VLTEEGLSRAVQAEMEDDPEEMPWL